MSNISKYVARGLGIESEAGITMIEYGLIAGLIAVAILSGITLVGSNLSNALTTGAVH